MPLTSPVSARLGEVHWTKVLQANLIPPPGESSLDGSPAKVSGRSRGQHLSIPGKINQKRKATKRRLSAGSSNKLPDEASKGNTGKNGNIVVRFYTKLVQWISPSRKTNSDADVSDSSSSYSDYMAEWEDSGKGCRARNNSISTSSSKHKSEQNHTAHMNPDSSTFQNLFSMDFNEKCHRNSRDYNIDSGFTSPICLTGNNTPYASSEMSLCNAMEMYEAEGDGMTSDMAARTYSWPTTVRRRQTSDDDGFIDWEGVVTDHTIREDSTLENEEGNTSEKLLDYSIPFSDLQLKDCLKRATRHHIFRGNWHGDVIVHQFIDVSAEHMDTFWENINRLSKIRHENIVLFMGACVHPPHLAIVTSGHRGTSLYEHIHIRGEFLPLQTKVTIIRQITRGLGYLHAKGVVMGTLNSRNIILDAKVKLSLLDNSMADSKYDRPEFAILQRGVLTYIPAEQMRSMTVAPPCVQWNMPNEQEGDVFAFGTTLYEILCGAYPFSGETVDFVIYNVGTGHSQCLGHLKCSSSLKKLIKRCWSYNKHNRPTCVELNQTLNQNFGLHKKHSSSVPERVDQLTKGRIS